MHESSIGRRCCQAGRGNSHLESRLCGVDRKFDRPDVCTWVCEYEGVAKILGTDFGDASRHSSARNRDR